MIDKLYNYTRVFLLVAVLVIFFIFPTEIQAQVSASLELKSDQTNFAVDEELVVQIYVDTDNNDTSGVDVRYLHYDPAILEVVDADSTVAGVQITPGNLYSLTPINLADNTAGTIIYSQVTTGASTYNGSGVLAQIKFKALQAGLVTLYFDHIVGATNDSNIAANGIDILASVNSLALTITSASGSNPPPSNPPPSSPPPSSPPPPAPTVSQPTVLQVIQDGQVIKLTWINPADSDFAFTRIYRSDKQGNLGEVLFDNLTSTSITDSTVAADKNYFYTIRAVNKNGQESTNLYSGQGIKIESASTPVAPNRDQQIANILQEAGLIYQDDFISLLNNLKINFDSVLEAEIELVYLPKIKAQQTTGQAKERLVRFIAYGTGMSRFLGSGERAGVINSFRSAFGRLPSTQLDWEDVLKIANGRWPNQRSQDKEKQASDIFKKIYLRSADMAKQNDNAAVTVITYGLRPYLRNLDSEAQAVLTYKNIFNSSPSAAEDWDIVRAIAYSGAVR